MRELIDFSLTADVAGLFCAIMWRLFMTELCIAFSKALERSLEGKYKCNASFLFGKRSWNVDLLGNEQDR